MGLRRPDDNAASTQWIYALSACNRETARCAGRWVMDEAKRDIVARLGTSPRRRDANRTGAGGPGVGQIIVGTMPSLVALRVAIWPD